MNSSVFSSTPDFHFGPGCTHGLGKIVVPFGRRVFFITDVGVMRARLAAVVDPLLTTTGLPPGSTAMTGIDAMVHAIEVHASAIDSNNPAPLTLAFDVLRLLGCNLLPTVRHGSDLDARPAMLLGATPAGQAFANSPVAAVHALAICAEAW